MSTFDKDAEDPLELLKTIHSTHLAGGTADLELRKIKANKLYSKLKQFKHETVAMFNALKAMEAVGEPIPSDAQQGISFIKRLDKTRFAQLEMDYDKFGR